MVDLIHDKKLELCGEDNSHPSRSMASRNIKPFSMGPAFLVHFWSLAPHARLILIKLFPKSPFDLRRVASSSNRKWPAQGVLF